MAATNGFHAPIVFVGETGPIFTISLYNKG